MIKKFIFKIEMEKIDDQIQIVGRFIHTCNH